ncbi:hypothetical protein [Kitasatospora sp. A2-31]|uniref:hypothetical protein n=1 Tax=Kitasatospora sp. A2-31 TaxID=2916414 RepID=UPI001EE79BDC|nr:hypothetical protein [Kitasatospora sp. A2-31]MCG6493760.1 hypothetical protein [Kitasatospora sp. A2-31]
MDGWVEAWTGGARAVHLGNVADFNEQFFGAAMDDAQRARRLRQAHHYACMATCYSPEPALVVLPAEVERAWVDWLARELAWEPVELYGGVAPGGTLAQALAARPALAERIAECGRPVLPWGRTAAQGEGSALAAVRRYESKAATHALFAELAPAHPGIAVPHQEQPGTTRRAARRLTARAVRGLTTVVKSPHGVGGYGTAVVTPQELFAAGGGGALLRRLARAEVLAVDGGLLLEEYVDGGRADRLRDLTFDAVIGPDGRVHPVGVGEMAVAGTSYQGVTVGPGVVPPGVAATAERFGLAVGERLAAAGHRGWFDVDFVTDRERRLAPTEANLRLTGPAIAFNLRARLDRVRGPGHVVRTLDGLRLGARLSQEALHDHLDRLRPRCARLGVTLLPLVVTAGYEPEPAVGLALAARCAGPGEALEALDAAEALVAAAGQALGRMFAALR